MKTKSETKSFISRRFEQIKQHFNLNNSQLAVVAGVTPTTIRDIVEGFTDNPKIDLISRICKSLGINYEWFFEENAEFLQSSISTKNSNEDFKEKYYRAVEILALNGIKLDLGKTNGVFDLAIWDNVFFNNLAHIQVRR